MDYGAEILSQVLTLLGDVGTLKSDVAGLRRDFERARDESSERLRAVADDLLGQIEQSDKEAQRLRGVIEQCPHHGPPAKASDQEGRRTLVRSLAAFLAAAATALGGWWASHTSSNSSGEVADADRE